MCRNIITTYFQLNYKQAIYLDTIELNVCKALQRLIQSSI